MKFKISKTQKVRKHLTIENLNKYLIIHNMTLTQLSKMFGISYALLGKIIKEKKYNLEEEKLNYELNKKYKIKIPFNNHPIKFGKRIIGRSI